MNDVDRNPVDAELSAVVGLDTIIYSILSLKGICKFRFQAGTSCVRVGRRLEGDKSKIDAQMSGG